MGTTRDDGSQQSMWVSAADLPQGGGHPFYEQDRKVKTPINFVLVLFVLFGSVVPVVAQDGNGSTDWWQVGATFVAAVGAVIAIVKLVGGMIDGVKEVVNGIKNDNEKAHNEIKTTIKNTVETSEKHVNQRITDFDTTQNKRFDDLKNSLNQRITDFDTAQNRRIDDLRDDKNRRPALQPNRSDA